MLLLMHHDLTFLFPCGVILFFCLVCPVLLCFLGRNVKKKKIKRLPVLFLLLFMMCWLECQGMANLGVRYSNEEVNLLYF